MMNAYEEWMAAEVEDFEGTEPRKRAYREQHIIAEALFKEAGVRPRMA